MKYFTSLFFLLVFSFSSNAQTTLSGKITDAVDGEELIGANLKIYKDDVFITGASTDFDGNYSLNIDSGIYDIEVSYIGYSTTKTTGIIVKAGQANVFDFDFNEENKGLFLCDFGCVWNYIVPMIEHDNTTTGKITTDESIRNLPIKNIHEIAAMTPGLSLKRF